MAEAATVDGDGRKPHDGRDLMEFLRRTGRDAYGSVILGDQVREVIGVELPAFGTREEFQRVQLRELAAVDYCRRVFLSEGKYLGAQQGDYRIYLPSENAKQIIHYHGAAMGKLRRADKLLKNTPQDAVDKSNSRAVRLAFVKDDLANGRSKFGRIDKPPKKRK